MNLLTGFKTQVGPLCREQVHDCNMILSEHCSERAQFGEKKVEPVTSMGTMPGDKFITIVRATST
jgi:hypothetical protein